ncbi:MAG TPA: SDR family NAD(P)-dependent oxidoreductase [Candidatus Limnocylindrales bacterium]|nr:SDR family NAD(P)-dependent oxidoreductase [Candidatus Limnocylindrales bacterium]
MDLGLRGKVALVGAASKGLGRAVAHALAAEGVRVAICARGAETLRRTAAEIAGQTGAEVCPVQGDVGAAADVERVVTSAVDRFGGLDILVTNAGGPKTSASPS